MQVDNEIIYDEDDLQDEYNDYYNRIKCYLKVQHLNPELEKKCTNDIIKELLYSQNRRYPIKMIVDDVIEYSRRHINNNRYLQDIRITYTRYIEFLMLYILSFIIYEAGYMKHIPWEGYFYLGTFGATIIAITILHSLINKIIVVMFINKYELCNALYFILIICIGLAIAFVPIRITNIYNYQIKINSIVFIAIIVIYFSALFYRLIIKSKLKIND